MTDAAREERERLLCRAWECSLPGASLVAYFAGHLAVSHSPNAEKCLAEAEALAVEYVRREEAIERLRAEARANAAMAEQLEWQQRMVDEQESTGRFKP